MQNEALEFLGYYGSFWFIMAHSVF